MLSIIDNQSNRLLFEKQVIHFVLDQYKRPWFGAKEVAKILNYTKPMEAIRKWVDHRAQRTLQQLQTEGKKINYQEKPRLRWQLKISPSARFINEFGVFLLLRHAAASPSSSRFDNFFSEKVLPSFTKIDKYAQLKAEHRETLRRLESLEAEGKKAHETNKKLSVELMNQTDSSPPSTSSFPQPTTAAATSEDSSQPPPEAADDKPSTSSTTGEPEVTLPLSRYSPQLSYLPPSPTEHLVEDSEDTDIDTTGESEVPCGCVPKCSPGLSYSPASPTEPPPLEDDEDMDINGGPDNNRPTDNLNDMVDPRAFSENQTAPIYCVHIIPKDPFTYFQSYSEIRLKEAIFKHAPDHIRRIKLLQHGGLSVELSRPTLAFFHMETLLGVSVFTSTTSYLGHDSIGFIECINNNIDDLELLKELKKNAQSVQGSVKPLSCRRIPTTRDVIIVFDGPLIPHTVDVGFTEHDVQCIPYAFIKCHDCQMTCRQPACSTELPANDPESVSRKGKQERRSPIFDKAPAVVAKRFQKEEGNGSE